MRLVAKTATAILASLILLVYVTVPGFAAGPEIVITNAAELGDAIRDQADGQVWRIKPGTYDLDATELAKYASVSPNGTHTNWYFPIFSSIEIIGEGNPTITSSVQTLNGNFNTQDFITVWADGVSISGVQIQSKEDVNKAIEIMAKDFTLTNSTILPITYSDGTVNSGSILWNTPDAGNCLIENVTVSSWIASSRASAGNIQIKNSTIDFTNHAYASNDLFRTVADDNNLINADGLCIKIDDNVADISKQIIESAPSGTVISLETDINLTSQLYINNKDITIDGNGHTITGDDTNFVAFSTDPSTQPMNLVSASGSNVTIKNVDIVVGDLNKHTLNVVNSDVVLDNVTLDNQKTTGGAALIINTSTVTVENKLEVEVGANSWYGVNLDNKANNDTQIQFEAGSSFVFDISSGKEMIVEDGVNKTEVITPTNAGIIKDDVTGSYRYIRAITGIVLDETNLNLTVGDDKTLTFTINPTNADVFSSVVWTSSDASVASVVNGKIVALKDGSATITATINGVSAACSVSVKGIPTPSPSATPTASPSVTPSPSPEASTAPTPNPTNSPSASTKPSPKPSNAPTTSPNTGDNSQVMVLFSVMGILITGTALTLSIRRRNKSND